LPSQKLGRIIFYKGRSLITGSFFKANTSRLFLLSFNVKCLSRTYCQKLCKKL